MTAATARALLVVGVTIPSLVFADQPPSDLDIEARATEAMQIEIKNHCTEGNALDQAFCRKDRLQIFDAELDELVALAIAQTKNMWGDEATAEQRQNIREAQAAWKTYRKEDCWFDYVPHQGVNTSSRQVENIGCEIKRTLRRMQEIRIRYMNDWR